MTFIRRSLPKPLPEHRCALPAYRWLPWLVWPRWREGAQWMCGYEDGINNAVYGGCRRVYEWRVIHGLYDTEEGWVEIDG